MAGSRAKNGIVDLPYYPKGVASAYPPFTAVQYSIFTEHVLLRSDASKRSA